MGSVKLKKVPVRTCMGCSEKKNKKELIRIVKNKNNDVFIDKTGKAEGRGAYICNSITCFEKVIKNKRLEKTLDISINKEVYENLKEVINDKQ